MEYSEEFQGRFWAKVNKTETCWLWTGSKNGGGYGQFRLGTICLAHRVSWELANGEIPESLHILHSCDNPACVNPKHLRPGTHLENMLDRVLSRRKVRALSNPRPGRPSRPRRRPNFG